MIRAARGRSIGGARALVAAVTALALLGVACSGGDGPAVDRGGGGGASLLPEDRLELPTFDFQKFERLLAELEGTPVLVNIWGSWCAPCRAEAPDLAELAREFEGRVQFLGVDILDTRDGARDFILEFDLPYPSVFDPEGEIRDRLGYIGQPVTVIYDREGEVSFEWVGATTAAQLRPEIEKVLER